MTQGNLTNRLAAALACLALLISVLAYTRPTRSTGDNAVGAAEAYIQGIAKQNSLKIDGMTVEAVREHGNTAIVRILVRYHPYLLLAPGKTLRAPESTVTLSIRENRSGWHAEYGAAQ